MKNSMKRNAFILLLIVFVAGCKKDKEETQPDNDTTTAIENARAEASYNDVANVADEAASVAFKSSPTASTDRPTTTCAVISIDTITIPHRITIDFGPVDCLCNDGNYRRGIIYVDFNGHYRDSASTHTISFNNYYVNYNKLDGTKTVTNNGRNASGNLSFTVVVNGSVTWDAQYGGGTSTYNSNRTREWISGESTWQWIDDVYLISGTAGGTTRTGASYSLATVTPLKKRIDWKHFVDGIVDFTPSGKPTRRIDYGYVGGAKDNLAQVTINGVTFTITLH